MDKVVWNIESVLFWTKSYFEKFCPNSPRLDAELLLSYVLGCHRLDLYLRKDKPLTKQELGVFRELVKRRSNGCPIAYLTGEKEFWSLKFEVNENTLIPRPDTEILVEHAVIQIREWQKKNPHSECQIAELGTGTAAIPLSLCSELENLRIISVDCKNKILKLASKNISRYNSLLNPRNNKVKLLKSDLFSSIDPNLKLDFIISNPPYIPSKNIDDLQVEISNFEPRIALDGGHDGLKFYRYLLETGADFLKSNGEMLLEIGSFNESELENILNKNRFWISSSFIKDFQGKNRVWNIKKNN